MGVVDLVGLFVDEEEVFISPALLQVSLGLGEGDEEGGRNCRFSFLRLGLTFTDTRSSLAGDD